MQEKVKKRHNPEITEKDLAVNAFDNLDTIVEKSDKIVEKEFLDLVKNCFGDLYVEENKYKSLSKTNSLENMTLYNIGWFQDCKSAKLEVDLPKQLIKSDAGELTAKRKFVENKKYAPIKITAHTKKALDQAKKFAGEYAKISGEQVRIVQDFVETKLEHKVENTSFKAIKTMGKKSWGFTSDIVKFCLVPLNIPTAFRKCDEKEKYPYLEAWAVLPDAEAGAPIIIIASQLPVITALYKLSGDRWESLLAYPIMNALSGLYEWYRYEKNKIEKSS
ncbi:hypothetical protein HY837_04535 [archaeon]|nr:hypothetical protein [archaeon]